MNNDEGVKLAEELWDVIRPSVYERSRFMVAKLIVRSFEDRDIKFEGCERVYSSMRPRHMQPAGANE